ncbi:MAG: PA2169 family four-helix-bundle protein [Planctomycetes bacterium]|nr:PA2169 family four-helix-bundle protein [Planctomycetota bacterium]
METTEKLSPHTTTDLHELIEISLDSAKGFDQAAESVDDPGLAMFFRECAAERRSHIDELRRFVPDYEPSGSFQGALHRWWLNLREKLSTDNRYPVLAEAERGEDAIKRRYEVLMKKNPGNALSPVLHDLYRRTKARHDQIREMRDRSAAN